MTSSGHILRGTKPTSVTILGHTHTSIEERLASMTSAPCKGFQPSCSNSTSYLCEDLFYQVQAPNTAVVAGSVEVVAGGWDGGEDGGIDGSCVWGVVAHTIKP